VDQYAVSVPREFSVRSHQRFGCGPLEKSARLRVQGRGQEVVCGRVADIQLDPRLKRGKLHQIRRQEIAVFLGWLDCQRFPAEFLYGPEWLDAKDTGRLLCE
jgi:hypothetical protein